MKVVTFKSEGRGGSAVLGSLRGLQGESWGVRSPRPIEGRGELNSPHSPSPSGATAVAGGQ